VNSVIDRDKKMNAKYGLSFPRVVDVRKKKQVKGTSLGEFISLHYWNLITEWYIQAL
jgi:hypothetical protein